MQRMTCPWHVEKTFSQGTVAALGGGRQDRGDGGTFRIRTQVVTCVSVAPLDLLDAQEAIALLSECVRANTVNPPGNEDRLTAILGRWLTGAGIPVEISVLAPGRANLLAHLRADRRQPGGSDAPARSPDSARSTQPARAAQPALVFSGHTDTVPTGDTPWQYDPWAATIVGDRLYGRGACDMKSGLAAMVMAMILLQRAGVALHGDLVLAASAGEEADCLGARAFIATDALAGAGGMVIGEPTGNELVIAHKGALWLQLTTTGRTAHGAMPEHGVNAILRMHQVVGRLQSLALPRRSHPLLGGSTLSINTIRGGAKTNVVPDRCSVEVDIRTVPGQSHAGVVDAVRAALADLQFPVEVEVLNDRPPVETDPQAPLVQAGRTCAVAVTGGPAVARQTAADDGAAVGGGVAAAAPEGSAAAEGAVPLRGAPYFTDASVYQPALGIPVLVYGPGDPRLAHQPDEWVALPAYLDAIRFHVRLALACLG